MAVLCKSLRRTARAEEQLRLASGSFHSLMVSKVGQRGLTPAEQETAILIVKGVSIAEMAETTGRGEGTIKAQSSATYQKSGLAGGVQFVSYFIAELIADL